MLPLRQWAQLPSSICTFREQFSASKPPVPPIVKTMLPAAKPPNDMHHMMENIPIHAGLTLILVILTSNLIPSCAASLPMLKWCSYVLVVVVVNRS
jgi:hypothetical protein